MPDDWFIGRIEICKPKGGPVLLYEIRLAPTAALEETHRRIKAELAERDRITMLIREEMIDRQQPA